MIRKTTNGDISDEEFNAILKPFLDNYDEYIESYVMPEVIAYYIANSYYRNVMYEGSFSQHYNSAKDLINMFGENEEFKIDEELIPPEWIRNYQSYFGIIMNDNSMDPEFHKDDCLIIRERKKMDKDGFYCILEKNSDYAKIRKLIHINDGIMVMPLNMGDNIQPKTYLKGTLEFESLRIIGIVVQVKRKYI